MGKFLTASEKVAEITGKPIEESKLLVQEAFRGFAEYNDFEPMFAFMAILEGRIRIVVTSNELGGFIGFFCTCEDCEITV